MRGFKGYPMRMATDLLSPDKTKSAQSFKGDVSAKDKASSSPKAD